MGIKEEAMECKKEENLKSCACPYYSCDRKGVCCECFNRSTGRIMKETTGEPNFQQRKNSNIIPKYRDIGGYSLRERRCKIRILEVINQDSPYSSSETVPLSSNKQNFFFL